MARRDPGSSFPARISRSSMPAARSESVSVPAPSTPCPMVVTGMLRSGLFQHQLVEVDLALQHGLLRHDIDPPFELFAFNHGLRIVRRKHLDQFKRLLGEFGNRGTGLVAIRID